MVPWTLLRTATPGVKINTPLPVRLVTQCVSKQDPFALAVRMIVLTWRRPNFCTTVSQVVLPRGQSLIRSLDKRSLTQSLLEMASLRSLKLNVLGRNLLRVMTSKQRP